ncbi:MAG: hypothetical protein A3C35_04685 [Omnitrophica bacterium RIFCSPHIGHO2_02_FULL_46_11]|nr:MAG: hypothetical protein A3C35_04685 [Omnitrophica bacterium RIFCSPHIGHO2_02_FULL_46_11]OGW87738.1 MAG: hypothetical protein A3A81_01380 [Omnitrophica bacterium RIFCSPLOWO2_01_FULL_45_10b]
MNSLKIAFGIWILMFIVAVSRVRSETEKDFAVPAFSDLQVLGNQNGTAETLPHVSQLDRAPFPEIKKLRQFDMNHDSQLNDFDVKQFQSIIESLNGEKLTGLQVTARLRIAQKNQKESFPVLYDLNKDGLFTSSDVDYFAQIIDEIFGGASRGNELIQSFRFQVFPAQNSEPRRKK